MTNNNINELRYTLNQLLNKAENTEDISVLTTMSNTVDAIEKDYDKVQSDYQDVFNSYKEMIKHTSFKPVENEQIGTGLPEKKSLDDIIKDAIKTVKNN